MKSRKSAIAMLFLAWMVGACSGEQSRWTGTIIDSAGVTIVSNPAEGLWSEAERWTVEEDLRIGVVEGDPNYWFGEIGTGGVTTDSRGRIYLLDHQAQHIKVFSREGDYLRTLGGRGGGPGVYSLDGRLKRIITKQHEPRPVTDDDIQVIRDYFEARWIRAGVPAEAYARLHRRWQYGEFFPAFHALVSGPAGTIWAQHALPPSEMSGTEVFSLNFHEEWASRDWDVFDSNGRFLGVVTLPELFTAKLFRGDKIYGVWRDEFEVQYVVRLRIVGDLGIGAK